MVGWIEIVTECSSGFLVVLSGPSGAGKTSLAGRLLDHHSRPGSRLVRSVSVTTRPPRAGEINGQDYFFVTEDRFASMLAEGQLLEHAELYGHRYGTPRAWIENSIQQGADVLLVLDIHGRRQIAANYPDSVVSLFLLPPSIAELEQRLNCRSDGRDQLASLRLAAANREMAYSAEYDYMLVNHHLDDSLAYVNDILRIERSRRYVAKPRAEAIS